MTTRLTRTRMEGLRDLDRVLKMLPREMRRKELEGALMTGTNQFRKNLQAATPRGRTGQASANVKRRRYRNRDHSATVLVGWFRQGFYLVWYEFGSANQPARPFARPVFDQDAPDIMRRTARSLAMRLDRAAKRIAGPYARSGLRSRRGRRRR